MSHELKDGSTTEDPRLDRLVEFDERSRGFPVSEVIEAPRIESKLWRLPRSYYGDQGREGACVEFGITHDLAAQPVVVPRPTLQRIRDEHLIYHPAQREDPWPGGSYPNAVPFYEGTSVLAGLRVAQRLGFFGSYRWAFTIDQAIAGVVAEGPAVVGVWMNEGMMDARPSGLIRSEGRDVGGHCMAWIGVLLNHKLKGEPRQDVAVLAQSWGLNYGDRGRVYLPLTDMEERLRHDGECAFALDRRIVKI